jgi:hypothetical protein
LNAHSEGESNSSPDNRLLDIQKQVHQGSEQEDVGIHGSSFHTQELLFEQILQNTAARWLIFLPLALAIHAFFLGWGFYSWAKRLANLRIHCTASLSEGRKEGKNPENEDGQGMRKKCILSRGFIFC